MTEDNLLYLVFILHFFLGGILLAVLVSEILRKISEKKEYRTLTNAEKERLLKCKTLGEFDAELYKMFYYEEINDDFVEKRRKFLSVLQ